MTSVYLSSSNPWMSQLFPLLIKTNYGFVRYLILRFIQNVNLGALEEKAREEYLIKIEVTVIRT